MTSMFAKLLRKFYLCVLYILLLLTTFVTVRGAASLSLKYLKILQWDKAEGIGHFGKEKLSLLVII